MNYQKLVDLQMDCFDPFSSPCLIPGDIEKGAMSVSKIDQETSGSIKNEISLTKPLRRQNSLHTGRETIPPLKNHLLMLLKFDSRDGGSTNVLLHLTHDRLFCCSQFSVLCSIRNRASKTWLQGKDLIIESDSKNAICWSRSKENCPWHLRFVWNKLQGSLKSFRSVSLVQQNREVNEIVDSLAKQGLEEHIPYIWWDLWCD